MITFEEIGTGKQYSLSDFGMKLQSGYSFPTPGTRDKTVTIPGKNGSWDFGSDLDIRKFSFPIGLISVDRIELQKSIRQFISFLFDPYGKPKIFKLIFDYEPDKYYLVRYSGQISPQRLFRLGAFDLPLTAFDPMAKFVVTSNDIIMDSDIPILSDLLWDTGVSNRSITGPDSFEIINNGTVVILFAFHLVGSGDNVSISANGKTMTLGSFSNKTFDVTDNYIVKVNGISDLTSTNGVFLELLPGVNEINIEGSNLNLTISESLTYQYI